MAAWILEFIKWVRMMVKRHGAQRIEFYGARVRVRGAV
jgi:hypothetical protein